MKQLGVALILALVVFGVIAIGTLSYRNSTRLAILGNFQLPESGSEPDTTAILARAEFASQEAQNVVNMAFNLLGLFEAFGLVIAVGGVVLGAFGLNRFTTAQGELENARKEVLESVAAAYESLNKAIAEREAELKSLRSELEQAAEYERQRTSDALLANAMISLGERQYRTSDYTGALTTYNRALELDPGNPVINQRIGYVYIQSGELDKARAHYERAIAREKDFAPALAGLGFVYRRLGEQVSFDNLTEDERDTRIIERDQLLNRSEDLLLQALKLSPKLVDDDGESYWGILGGLYKRRGQIDQAIEAYIKVTEVTPQSSYGYGNLALLYQKKDERTKMLDIYKKVEHIASKEADAEAGNFWGYADLIVSSYAIGKVEQAEDSLPIAISIAPEDSPYMLKGLADTLRELVGFLDQDKLPPIKAALKILDDEMARRADLVNDKAGG